MPMIDVGLFQNWIQAFDNHERAQRRYDAAAKLGDRALIDYLRPELDAASGRLNAAIKELRSSA